MADDDAIAADAADDLDAADDAIADNAADAANSIPAANAGFGHFREAAGDSDPEDAVVDAFVMEEEEEAAVGLLVGKSIAWIHTLMPCGSAH